MSTAVIERHIPVQPDPVRILALGFAISLNAAMLMLALRPLAPRLQPVRAPEPVRVLVLQPLPVTPPQPPQPVMPRPLPTAPVPPVHRVPVRPPQPPVSDTPMPVPQPQVVAQAPTTPVTVAPTSHTASTAPIQAHLAYLRAPAPRYPVAARRMRMQGTVTLKVLVDAQGRPQDVRIDHSSGYPLLDRAARLQVLRKWLFQPAHVNGRPAPAWALVPVAFTLRMN